MEKSRLRRNGGGGDVFPRSLVGKFGSRITGSHRTSDLWLSRASAPTCDRHLLKSALSSSLSEGGLPGSAMTPESESCRCRQMYM